MPRVKGRPKHYGTLDAGADSGAEAFRSKETPIECPVKTIFKCEKSETSSRLAEGSEGGTALTSTGTALLKSTTTSPASATSTPSPAQPPKPANRSKRKRDPDAETPKESSGASRTELVNIEPKKEVVKQQQQQQTQPQSTVRTTAEKAKLPLRPLRPLPQPVTKFVLPAITPPRTTASTAAAIAKSEREKVLTTCSVCAKVLRRGSLREHMDRHENSGKFECLTCGKNFSRASTLEKHVRAHTGERPFQCSVCLKAYRQKVHLSEHMRSHTGERPFVCRLCGFSVTSKSLLNRHLRTHGVNASASEVPEMWLRTDAPAEQVLAAAAEVGRSLAAGAAACSSSKSPSDLCVTALNGTATLAELARRHLCDVCPAGFPTLQALRSHRLTTHGLATAYACPTCQASLPSAKALKAHFRTDHPQICPICNEVMSQRRRWVLEVHLREHHPGISAESVLGPSPLSQRNVKRSATIGAKTPGPPRELASKVPDARSDNLVEDDVAATKREAAAVAESSVSLVVHLQFQALSSRVRREATHAEEEEDSESSIIQQLRGHSQSRSPSPSPPPSPPAPQDSPLSHPAVS